MDERNLAWGHPQPGDRMVHVFQVACHLEGWTARDLAAHLGCPEEALWRLAEEPRPHLDLSTAEGLGAFLATARSLAAGAGADEMALLRLLLLADLRQMVYTDLCRELGVLG